MSILSTTNPTHILTWERDQASRINNPQSHCTTPTTGVFDKHSHHHSGTLAKCLHGHCESFPRPVHSAHSIWHTQSNRPPANSKRVVGTTHSRFFSVQSHVPTVDGKPTGGRGLYKCTVPTMWQIWTWSWLNVVRRMNVGNVSSKLCVWKLERVCSETQLCQLRCI